MPKPRQRLDNRVIVRYAHTLYERQQGRCAICNTSQETEGQKLAVDHDHISGAIRALLCRRCNQAIGAFQDNPALLHAAANYLEHHHQRLAQLRTLATQGSEQAPIVVS